MPNPEHLYALNSMEHGIRGINAPREITVKHFDGDRNERVVAVVKIIEGQVLIMVGPGVAIETLTEEETR